MQLLHEVEVGRDEVASRLDKVVREVESPSVIAHEVCDADGSRPTDASLTVDQHLALTVPHSLCNTSTSGVKWNVVVAAGGVISTMKMYRWIQGKHGNIELETKRSGVMQWTSGSQHMSLRNTVRCMAM